MDPDTGAVTTRHFGYTVVTAPPSGASGAGVEAREVETIGVRIADGFALGYARERRLAVPGDCRLVFVVRDPAQMAWATARAAELQERGELCVALEP
ncbi:MAG: hypothetical protein NXI21_03260 [Alphaproteobacteria bacterium]|nr:hypothetical protein [Alphaproteobacteria bacterium]